MELRVETRAVGDCSVVTPVGELDLSTAGQLRQALDVLYLQAGADVVVDLDQLSFIDSAGLGTLIGARRRASSVNGSLTVVCTCERTLRLFQITRLDRVFDIVESHPALETS